MAEITNEQKQEVLDGLKSVLTPYTFIQKDLLGSYKGLNQLEGVVTLLFNNQGEEVYSYFEVDTDEIYESIENDEEAKIILVGLDNVDFNPLFTTAMELDLDSDVDLEDIENTFRENNSVEATAFLQLVEVTEDKQDNFLDHADTEPLRAMLNKLPKTTTYLQYRDVVSGVLYKNEVLDASAFVNAFSDLLSPYSIAYVSAVPEYVRLSTYAYNVFKAVLLPDNSYTTSMYFEESPDEVVALVGTLSEITAKVDSLIESKESKSEPIFFNLHNMSGFQNIEIDFSEETSEQIINSIQEIYDYIELLTEIDI